MGSPSPPGVASTAEVQLGSRTDGPAYLRGLARQHGDIVSLGDRAWLVNDPRAARYVLTETGGRFASIADFLGRAVPATSYGVHHRAALAGVHRLVSSWGSAPNLRRVQELIRTRLVAREGVIEPVALGRQIGLSIATEACLGTPAPPVERAAARLLDTLLPKFSSPWLLPWWWPSPRRLKLSRSDAVLTRRLAAATGKPPQVRPGSVLDLLSRRTPAQLEGSKPTWAWIKTLLLASQEPTGAAPGWTLHRLLTEPTWLERVRDEVAALDPLSTDVTVPVRQFPVTAAVVQEALRLRTPTWLVGRRAVTDIEINGYHGPPGHMVFVSPWLLHQREELYAQPLTFDPNRWLDPARSRTAHQGYFSFSKGTHSCPGRLPSLALTICLVAALVRNYHLRLPHGVEVTTDARRSMLPAGLQIHVTPRAAGAQAPRAAGAQGAV